MTDGWAVLLAVSTALGALAARPVPRLAAVAVVAAATYGPPDKIHYRRPCRWHVPTATSPRWVCQPRVDSLRAGDGHPAE